MDFIIVGGGCFGSFYVRQLLRGADRLRVRRIHVVDHNPDCQAKREFGDPLKDPNGLLLFHRAEWGAFLFDYFDRALKDHEAGKRIDDHYVPPTYAPHLLLDFMIEKASREFPDLLFSHPEMETTIGTPVDIPLAAGTRALSFATWTCPATCIEPPTCPHTRGPKDWDMKTYLKGQVDSQHVFQCRHYAMGVGTIPVSDILEEYLKFRNEVGQAGTHRTAVATVSSCHGLIGLVEARHV